MPQLETSQKVIDDEDFLFDDVDPAELDDFSSQPKEFTFDPNNSPPPPPSDVKIKDELTSTIAENAPDDSSSETTPGGKSWLSKLSPLKPSSGEASSNVGETGNISLEGLVKETKQQQKQTKPKGSNASVFDISGVMLRMSLEQADKALTTRGYKKTSETLEIPNFIKWRNEEICRNQGVIGYERLNSCVVEMAKKDNHQYVETITYINHVSNEEITLKLTSNFTNNKIYRIYYRSHATALAGNSQKAIYLRNIKIYDFWKRINQKYGVPDNKEEVIWTLSENAPFLQAATGKLLLEDPMLKELDFTRMSREDQRYLNTSLYNF